MPSFQAILTRMLALVSAARDKRQGSIIYDTLSPTAMELAQMNINIEIFKEQTYLLTATGINLENRAADHGITRKQATYAVRIAEMINTDGNPLDLPVGSRFSAPNTVGLNFVLTANTEMPGECLLTCETAGTTGNAYLGPLLPLFVINNLRSATMTGTYIPAEDTETDANLRKRVLERINKKAYGGNVAQYREWTIAIEGVGEVKVFPIWDGGGTVMLSIVDDEYLPVSSEFIGVVQTEMDPIPNSGEGLGTAPIGHRVTVVTPTKVSIYIVATVALRAGYTIAQLQNNINSAIEAYLLELRQEWGEAGSLSVFLARINAAIISVEGVNNVTNTTINGSAADLNLIQTSAVQQIPVFGSVTLYGG